MAAHRDAAHWDMDQSTIWANLWPQCTMYDNLIRFNPLDGGRTIVPDLAKKWDISPDGLTYTFYLQEGVKFHDGTPFTADDVVATYKRRIWPPEGVVGIRKDLFNGVKSVEAVDPLTVRFVLSEPRAYLMEAFASGWSAIFSKKSLEENKNDLRRIPNSPGTGPFRFVEAKTKGKFVVERNPDYWNKGLPYLDRIERLPIDSGPEAGTAVLTNNADFTEHASIDTLAEGDKRKDVIGGTFLNPATWAETVWFNTQKAPFNDARVRRAVHLAVSRQDLAKAWEMTNSTNVGTRWVNPGSPYATPTEEIVKMPGYRADKEADIAEAKKLMAEAGLADGVKGLVFLNRGMTGVGLEIFAPTFQDQIKKHLKIECAIKPVEASAYFDIVRAGDYHLTYGAAIAAINDPSDCFNQWFKTGGSQNYSNWSNPKFDELLRNVDREMDPDKRRSLIRQAEDLLDQEVPLFNTGWARRPRMWRKEVKGVSMDLIGCYLANRYDTLWLDK